MISIGQISLKYCFSFQVKDFAFDSLWQIDVSANLAFTFSPTFHKSSTYRYRYYIAAF